MSEEKPSEVQISYQCVWCGRTFEKGKLSRVAETRCPYCVPAGTLVLTETACVPIQDVHVGSRVMCSTGSFTSVAQTYNRMYEGNLIRIKASKLLPFELTPEHPVLVAETDRKWFPELYKDGHGNSYRRIVSKISWIEASHVRVGDYLVVPRLKYRAYRRINLSSFIKTLQPSIPSKIIDGLSLDPQLGRFFGRYVADGSCSTRPRNMESAKGETRICFGKEEEKELDHYYEIAEERFGYEPNVVETETGIHLVFGYNILSRALGQWFGRYADEKRLPDFIMGSDEEIVRQFIHGYYSGDGCTSGMDVGIASTVSKGLASQIQMLTTKIGALPTLIEVRRSNTGRIGNRTINQKDRRYFIDFSPKDLEHIDISFKSRRWRLARRKYLMDQDYIYVPVTKIEHVPYRGLVYNLGTCAETFTVSNVVTHNCGFNVIKKTRGGTAKLIESSKLPS